jgi:cbb3-type cytochrome oxidase subunit 1
MVHWHQGIWHAAATGEGRGTMNTTTIRFLKAGMAYLLIGGFLGVLLSLPVTRDVLNASHPGAQWGLAHAHIVLAGFVMMVIFGIAYHILPRFAGKPLRSERWAAAHFWLAAPATAAMAIGFTHAFAAPLLWAGGVAQFAGIVLGVVNLWWTIR